MCGIAGQISFIHPVEERNLRDMNRALSHRGPDGEGVYLNENKSIGFAHRRLAFLDLSDAGKQPMANEDGSLWVTYNGEIYNYIELRAQLQKYGHQFKSDSDTEVIIHGFEQWGSNVLSKLKGMFAFAIWNEKTQELFLARDRFGIKPLYYYFDAERKNFVFASEIKGIKANDTVSTTLNPKSVSDFFTYRYVPSPYSIWKEVHKLPPANFLTYSKNQGIRTEEYWKISFGDREISDKEAIEKFDDLLLTSVKTHARSDVAVGSFLSGGYDSSAIVYYMSRFGYLPDTFSIGFEGWDVSEHLYANMVAKQYGTHHHDLILESQSLNLLDELVYVYDEPNADISIIPTFLVSREAAKSVKAVMSGEGSDEFLVGYQWQKDYEPKQKSWKDNIMHLLTGKKNNSLIDYYASCMAMGRFDNPELLAMYQSEFANGAVNKDSDWWYKKLYRSDLDDMKAMQFLDVKHFMGEQVLAKVDRASMANSLEVRVPFLDHEICEFVFSLQTNIYYKKNETKHLLYRNLIGHLPKEILNRKKQGFVGPDKYYMNYAWYQERLHSSKLADDGIIRQKYIDKLLFEKDHWRLWKVAVMELWYRKWVKA